MAFAPPKSPAQQVADKLELESLKAVRDAVLFVTDPTKSNLVTTLHMGSAGHLHRLTNVHLAQLATQLYLLHACGFRAGTEVLTPDGVGLIIVHADGQDVSVAVWKNLNLACPNTRMMTRAPAVPWLCPWDATWWYDTYMMLALRGSRCGVAADDAWARIVAPNYKAVHDWRTFAYAVLYLWQPGYVVLHAAATKGEVLEGKAPHPAFLHPILELTHVSDDDKNMFPEVMRLLMSEEFPKSPQLATIRGGEPMLPVDVECAGDHSVMQRAAAAAGCRCIDKVAALDMRLYNSAMRRP